MVVLIVGFKYGDAITMTAPSGWTVVSNNEANNTGLTNSGNDSGNVRGAVFFREYDGVWTMPSITTSGNYDVSMRGVVSYTKAAGEAWVAPVCANAVDNTTSSVGLDPAASGTTIPISTGDRTGSVGFQNGDVGTFSSHNIAVSGVTFGTQATRLGAASTVGTDMRIHSIDRLYTSGTAGGGPDGSVVMTTGGGNDAGVMVFYRLRVAIPGTGAGDASASGTANGQRTVTAALAGAAVGSGTAAGQPTVVSTATGAATASGAAAGLSVRPGTATGAATASGTATGLRTVLASAVGAATGAGTASGIAGSLLVIGTATGAATASGTAVGKRTVTGVATGTVGGPVSIYLGSTPVSRIYINP
jgi:hypothetical protein